MKKLFFFLSLVLTFHLFSGFTTIEENLPLYDLTCLYNDTDYTIYYSLKKGDGNWKNFNVRPGRSNYHSWKNTGSNRNWTPMFFIRFNSSIRGYYNEKSYRLENYTTNRIDCNNAKKYKFKSYGRKGCATESIDLVNFN